MLVVGLQGYLQPRAMSSYTLHSHLGGSLLPLQRWVLAVSCPSRNVTAGEVCQHRHVMMQPVGTAGCLGDDHHWPSVPLPIPMAQHVR